MPKEEHVKVVKFSFHGQPAEFKHGSVVIAAITSCTNTSNPSVMLGAGLVGKRACARGLEVAIGFLKICSFLNVELCGNFFHQFTYCVNI